ELANLGQDLDEQWYTIQNRIKAPSHSLDELKNLIDETKECINRLQMYHTALTTSVQKRNET
ncbi:hypothetical protein, partial [Lacticaseibacillus rhamnosus]|uniref:hypothetical protein n=1 Tax=Lacticaseibacillus rhamnosus TaxID=47715 RepID=UPI0019520B39